MRATPSICASAPGLGGLPRVRCTLTSPEQPALAHERSAQIKDNISALTKRVALRLSITAIVERAVVLPLDIQGPSHLLVITSLVHTVAPVPETPHLPSHP